MGVFPISGQTQIDIMYNYIYIYYLLTCITLYLEDHLT